MSDAAGLLIAKSDKNLFLLPKMANRHGLIAGATGTGKTVSLQVMAEGFSAAGVPVFMADVKGDLAGISQAGKAPYPIRKPANPAHLLKVRRTIRFSISGTCVILLRLFPSELFSSANSI